MSPLRRMFFRGLSILLPTTLTIALLLVAYQYLDNYVAQPINAMLRESVLLATNYPSVSKIELEEKRSTLNDEEKRAWNQAGKSEAWLTKTVRRDKLERIWSRYAVFLNLIGLAIAAVLIYLAGTMVGSYIGSSLALRIERAFREMPIVRQVYPAVKQITEFIIGSDDTKIKFSRVVAVEWPRKGIWSMGLVTGDTMRAIEEHAGEPCLTIFIPNSPTPFTGFVITSPKRDTIDLPISIEEAIKFTISGGVVIPPSQLIRERPAPELEVQSQDAAESPPSAHVETPHTEAQTTTGSANSSPASDATSDETASPAVSPQSNTPHSTRVDA